MIFDLWSDLWSEDRDLCPSLGHTNALPSHFDGDVTNFLMELNTHVFFCDLMVWKTEQYVASATFFYINVDIGRFVKSATWSNAMYQTYSFLIYFGHEVIIE